MPRSRSTPRETPSPAAPRLDEPGRLAALAAYGILDTPPEAGFEDVVRLATRLCATPVALVSFVDADRQWFKARTGFPECQTDLDRSVCRFALDEPDLFVVPDLTKDPRTADNPLVTGPPNIRFYAGAPLRSADGHALGSLCVIDTVPRPGGLTPEQAEDLRALGRQVTDLLEMRRSLAARDALLAEQDSARREREAFDDAQATIAGAGGAFDAVLGAVAAGALRAVPAAEGAAIELIDGEDLEYRVTSGTLAPHRGLRIPLGDSLAGRCALTVAPLLAEDVERDGTVKPHLAARLGLRSAVMAPISRGGRVVGVLKLQAGRPGAFGARDVELARLFANMATAGLTEIAEAQAQRAVATSHARYLTLFEAIEAGFCIVEVRFGADGRAEDYRFLEVNPAFARQTGLADAVGRWMRALAPDHEQHWFDAYGRVARTGEPVRFESGAEALGRWYDVHAFRVGAPGEHRVAVLFNDITERRHVERALRESEERSRAAQQAGRIGTFELDVATGEMKVSAEFCRLYGLPPAEMLQAAQVEALVVPADADIVSDRESRTDGSASPDVEYRVKRADDGRLRWIARRAEFARDAAGHVGRMFGTVHDVTDRRRLQEHQAALLELGDRLREAGTVADVVGAASRTLGRTLGASRAGYARVDVRGGGFEVERDWTMPGTASIAGRHALSSLAATMGVLARGETVTVANIPSARHLQPDAAAYAALGILAQIKVPLVERGELVGLLFAHQCEARTWTQDEVAFAHGVADRTHAALGKVRAEEQQVVINHELAHRLKNTLAVVQSIAGQTLRDVAEREAVEGFERRLLALSRAHDILIQRTWTGARMRTVMEGVLSLQSGLDRFAFAGPDLDLGPQAVLSLTLLLHELATNAAKYGALAGEEGSVAIHWLAEEGVDPRLILDWTETGGPPVTAPARRGFGSKLIRMGLLGLRDVELDYAPAGLRARFKAPLAEMRT